MFITYWYIVIPTIAVIIALYIFIEYFQYVKQIKSLNTEEKQKDYSIATGSLPIEMGKFTKKYKNWLIENQRKKIIKETPGTQFQPIHQPQPSSPQQTLISPQTIYSPPPVERKKSEVPPFVIVPSKDFKIKLSDYTVFEKIIKILTVLITIIIVIPLLVLMISSFLKEAILRGMPFLIVLIVILIMNYIIHLTLQKRARTRRLKVTSEPKLQPMTIPSVQSGYPSQNLYIKEIPPQTIAEQEKKLEKKICPYCGAENLSSNKFCLECGSTLN